jgi:hypothetical protein
VFAFNKRIKSYFQSVVVFAIFFDRERHNIQKFVRVSSQECGDEQKNNQEFDTKHRICMEDHEQMDSEDSYTIFEICTLPEEHKIDNSQTNGQSISLFLLCCPLSKLTRERKNTGGC